jgi:hypothetical protein
MVLYKLNLALEIYYVGHRWSRECGTLNVSQTYGPSRSVTGIAFLTFYFFLPLFLFYHNIFIIFKLYSIRFLLPSPSFVRFQIEWSFPPVFGVLKWSCNNSVFQQQKRICTLPGGSTILGLSTSRVKLRVCTRNRRCRSTRTWIVKISKFKCL